MASTEDSMPTTTDVSRVRNRLAEGCKTLDALDRERRAVHDPQIGKAAEQKIVQRELLELELQDLDDQMDRIREATANIARQQ